MKDIKYLYGDVISFLYSFPVDPLFLLVTLFFPTDDEVTWTTLIILVTQDFKV